MLDITITETRDFVKKLLMDNTFDRFLAMEAFVKSGITYSFDGRVNKDFYDKEELELMASTSVLMSYLPSSPYSSFGTLKASMSWVARVSLPSRINALPPTITIW
mgnify:CR=1 FL=1